MIKPHLRPLIIHAIGTLGPGGAERQLAWTVRGLAEYTSGSCEVLVDTIDVSGTDFFLPTLTAGDISVTSYTQVSQGADVEIEPHARLRRVLPFGLDMIPALVGYLTQRRPTVVHCWLDQTNVTVGVAAALAGVPRIVLGVRSAPPFHFAFHRWYMRPLYRWLWKQRGVVVVANAQAVAREYGRWLGIDSSHIRVVPNGYPYNEESHPRSQGDRTRGSYLIGGVMRLSEEKRPDLWLEIATELSRLRRDVNFVLIGDGPLREACAQQIADRGIDARVQILGLRSDVLDLMTNMDLLMLTSRIEGLPNVLIEAQALGVPVVTTDVGGATEAINENLTGWVLRSTRPSEAAQMVNALLCDDDARRRSRKQGPIHVRENFGLDRMLRNIVKVYALSEVNEGD